MKPLRQQHRLAAFLAVFLLSACAGEAQRREGLSLVDEGRYEEGLAKLEEAVEAAPENPVARRDFLRQRERVVNRILNAANSELAQERHEAAEAQFRRALAVEPSNAQARKGLAGIETAKRHQKWLSEAQAQAGRGDTAGAKATVGLILVEDPHHAKANRLRFALAEQTLKESLAGPTLSLKARKPVTLQFRDANLRMVLEAISRMTSVNILVDKDVRNDIKVTIFVKDTPVEEAIHLILLQNQLEMRVLGENTILVYPFNAAKSKEYQPLKVRRFALTNADPKQVQGMLKTALNVKEAFVDEKTNAFIMRDTAQAIRLAERLVASMDQPEAEVMIELELLDVSRSRSLELGINWPASVSWMLPNSMTLAAYKRRSPADVVVSATPFGVAVKALASDGDTRVLANPRIRARNKEKARIMIGSRTPVISSAAVPNTTGLASVYNTNIQYLDTGIRLEVEPTVHLDGEVAIKLNMEVSDLGDRFENVLTGTLAYSTTTNNASTTLRLKDGETQVLAGLVRAYASNSAKQKVPGLGDIPVLGRLFGINADDWQNREIVLAITPHIVRKNQVAEADLLELWSGTEANLKFGDSSLRVAGTTGVVAQGPGARTPPAAEVSHGAAPGAVTAPSAAVASPLSAVTVPAEAITSPAGAVTSPSAAVTSPAGASLAALLTGPSQAIVGDRISIAVVTQGAADVNAVTFVLHYDPKILKAIAAVEGDLMRGKAIKSVFESRINEAEGIVVADLAGEGNELTSGSGKVASVEFQVIGKDGAATVAVSNISAVGAGDADVAVTEPPPLSISIR